MAFMTNYWGLDGIILLTVLMITAYFYMTRKFNYWKKRGVVEISPIPFMGNFTECLFLQKSPGDFLRDIYNRDKKLPYIGFYVFDKPCLLIRDRELVKNVLVKDFNNFSDRYSSPDVKDRLGYANLFFIKNPVWKILRTKLTPVFTSGKLKKMFELMLECAENLDVYFKSLGFDCGQKAVEVDLKEISAKFTTDVITSTAYGLKVNSLTDSNAEFRKYGKKVFDYNYMRSFQLLAIFFMPNIVRLAGISVFGKETTSFLRNALWDTMNQRMKSGQKRNDLIDILIEIKQNHVDEVIQGFRFDGDDLLAQAAVFFTAGFETSSSTASFTLYELALQPELQDRLRKEILNALDGSGGKITYELIPSLPYLDMVVAETLRKYPILPFLDRVSVDTYKVPNSDLVIEKGTPIYISMLGMHMDPEYFPDPDKYDPERFNEENKRNRPSCVYFPFGEGPHACIGTRLGLLQTKLVLIEVFSKYEVTPCENTIIPMVLDPKAFLASPLGGKIQLNMRKINSDAKY